MGNNRRKKQMDSNQIINNIKLFMKQNNDSVQSLANNVMYSNSTVYGYLNGTKSVTQDFINAVAKYYEIPVKVISYDKLTKNDVEKFYTYINEKEYQKYGECFFFVQNEKSASSEFDNAVKCLEYMNLSQTPSIGMISSCRNSFYTSFKKHGLLDGAANTLMTMLLEFAFLNLSPDYYSRAMLGTLKNKDVENNLEKPITKEAKTFIRDKEAIYNECLCALRNSKEYLDLYEYYLAMKYLFSFVNNRKSKKRNSYFGGELLWDLYELGNKYAREYIDSLEIKDA